MTSTIKASNVSAITHAKRRRTVRTDDKLSPKICKTHRLIGGVAILEENVVLDVDMATGEVIDERPMPNEMRLPSSKTQSLDQCRDKQEVLEWSGEDTRENVDQGKASEKLRWADAAVRAVMDSYLTKDKAQKFTALCDLIVTRNVILEDHTSDIAEHLGIKLNHVSGYLKAFEADGFIRFYKKNVFGRGRHIILVNPTICWRGFFHAGGDDYDEDGYTPYSASGFFSRIHKKAVEAWTMSVVSSSHSFWYEIPTEAHSSGSSNSGL
ncbi:hypothetical protein BWR19_06260 [Halomonas sp. 1513]|nr:helix-turn-helix domain-containing protein [Halomonas sp. 1513]APX92577.1 hypothetical protein BWR19_06260 [Halomonas sp. 1513]